jgi:hypothetical protein
VLLMTLSSCCRHLRNAEPAIRAHRGAWPIVAQSMRPPGGAPRPTPKPIRQ